MMGLYINKGNYYSYVLCSLRYCCWTTTDLSLSLLWLWCCLSNLRNLSTKNWLYNNQSKSKYTVCYKVDKEASKTYMYLACYHVIQNTLYYILMLVRMCTHVALPVTCQTFIPKWFKDSSWDVALSIWKKSQLQIHLHVYVKEILAPLHSRNNNGCLHTIVTSIQ